LLILSILCVIGGGVTLGLSNASVWVEKECFVNSSKREGPFECFFFLKREDSQSAGCYHAVWSIEVVSPNSTKGSSITETGLSLSRAQFELDKYFIGGLFRCYEQEG
jgi:hypothetical protein